MRYRPVLFAGLLAAHGHKGPAEIARKRTFTYRFVVWQAKRLGIPLKMPHEHPFNPLPLLRLAIACDCAPDAVHRIFRFVWRDGRLPDLPIEWAELANDLRLPDAQRRIEEPDVKAALRRNTDEAIERGVFGVPTLAVGDELFWGADATAMAADYLAAGSRWTDPEYERVASLPVGAARVEAGQARRSAEISSAPGMRERALDRARRRERVVERDAEARDVAHLAAAPRLRLAVQVQLGRRMAQHLAPLRLARRALASPSNHRSPSRFTITAGVCCRVSPSGRSASTRACCSNCDVTQASIEKCPLLCGRGAISLTSSAPSRVDEHLDAEDAAVIERRGDARCDLAGAGDRASALTRAGTIDTSRMPSRCRFSADRPRRAVAALVARDDHRYLARERDPSLEHAWLAAHRAPRLAQRPRASHARPGPCRRSRSARS